VLLLDDQSSGVGAILESSRLQGVLRGKPSGDVILEKIMADEKVQPGEKVLTSGGDQVFPKGLAVGTVMKVSTTADSFLNIRVKPSADLSKLEEVLVITQRDERAPAPLQPGMRAADILALRLPSVPDKPAEDPKKAPVTGAATDTVPQEPTPTTAAPAVTPANPAALPKAAPATTTPKQEKPQ
jgi:rod shape-determining protein MreC